MWRQLGLSHIGKTPVFQDLSEPGLYVCTVEFQEKEMEGSLCPLLLGLEIVLSPPHLEEHPFSPDTQSILQMMGTTKTPPPKSHWEEMRSVIKIHMGPTCT